MIYRWLGLSMPWLYMSAYFDYYNAEYVERLFNVSAKGEWSEWIEFCLKGTIAQANDSIRRCEAFKRLEEDFFKRVKSAGTKRSHPIIKDLFSTPIVTASGVKERHGVAFPTAQRDIGKLVDVGILIPLEGSYPQCYYSPEIIEVAHGDPHWDNQPATATIVFSTPPVYSSELVLPVEQSPVSALTTTWQIVQDHPSIPQDAQAPQRRGS
jgi:hypothetical protein